MKRKLKLVFFIGGLNFGGMERVAFIAGDLLKDEYDITYVTLYQSNPDYELSCKSYDIGVPPSYNRFGKAVGFVRRLIRTYSMKKKLNPDIVFSFGMYSNYLNAITKYREKIIMSIRSYDWLTSPFMTKKIDKHIVSKFDTISSVSKVIAQAAEVYWNVPVDENTVVYNPYDVNYLQKKSNEDVEDFEFDHALFYICTMGRLADQKGFNHLIRAFSECIGECPNIRLIVMGNGEKNHELVEMIQAYSMNDFIYLLGGKKNPLKYVKRSNLYVLSSITEGFPNAMCEAMAIGTPVVAVNCKSGPMEILCKNVCVDVESFFIADYGILSREMTMDKQYNKKELDYGERALKNAIIFSYFHPEITIDLAKRAQIRIKEYNYDTFKSQIINVIAR